MGISWEKIDVAAGLAGGEGAAQMAIVEGSAAFGGVGLIYTNVNKAETEKIIIETVEKLGREFMTIIKLIKDPLNEIEVVSRESEVISSSFRTTAGSETGRGLSKQLQKLLRQIAELAERSREVMNVTL